MSTYGLYHVYPIVSYLLHICLFAKKENPFFYAVIWFFFNTLLCQIQQVQHAKRYGHFFPRTILYRLINISIAVPPSFTKVPKTVISLKIGSTATIECGVFGVPKPTVQWSRALLPLPQGRSQQQDGRLTISGIQLQDSGTYVCKAMNRLGVIHTVSTLVARHQGKHVYFAVALFCCCCCCCFVIGIGIGIFLRKCIWTCLSKHMEPRTKSNSGQIFLNHIWVKN